MHSSSYLILAALFIGCALSQPITFAPSALIGYWTFNQSTCTSSNSCYPDGDLTITNNGNISITISSYSSDGQDCASYTNGNIEYMANYTGWEALYALPANSYQSVVFANVVTIANLGNQYTLELMVENYECYVVYTRSSAAIMKITAAALSFIAAIMFF